MMNRGLAGSFRFRSTTRRKRRFSVLCHTTAVYRCRCGSSAPVPRSSKRLKSWNPRSRGEVEPHDFYLEGEAGEGLRLYDAMMLSERGHERRDIMATTGQQMHPVAHWP